MALKCIIFDMDGTLAETGRLIFDSFNFIAERYRHRRFADDEIIKMFGPPEEEALLSIVGDDQIKEATRDYLEFYRAQHERLARLHPGMAEVLQFIRSRNCRLAIFTGKGTATTRISLQELGIAKFFDFIVTGNDVVNHKPSSEGIRKILAHFALAPGEAMMVGDSVSDIKASREAGVMVASVFWDSYAKEKVSSITTDLEFHTVGELDQWLRGHLG
jgi:pyrophosphatase PpaX